MSARSEVHPVFYSFRDYLRIEEEAPLVKHEYLAGQIYAMVRGGGGPKHALLAVGLMVALGAGRCSVYNSDLRMRVRKTGLCTYPDVSVVCGPCEPDPEDENTVTNPIVLVEVTSKSTEEYDRGVKFEHYQQIRSLREYVLVSHRERAIEVRHRTGTRWTSRVAQAGEHVVLSSVGVTLDVDVIYRAATEVAKERAGPHRGSSRNGTARSH